MSRKRRRPRRRKKERHQRLSVKSIPRTKSHILDPKANSEGRKLFPYAAGTVLVDLFTRMYDLHQSEALRSYGHDLVASTGYYVVSRGFFSYVLPNNRFFRSSKNILVGFALSSSYEMLQYTDSRLGTYDPNDFIAFGIGSVIAYGVHKHFEKRLKNSTSPSPTA